MDDQKPGPSGATGKARQQDGHHHGHGHGHAGGRETLNLLSLMAGGGFAVYPLPWCPHKIRY